MTTEAGEEVPAHLMCEDPLIGAGYMPNGGMHGTPFDSRAAEAAFSSADPYPIQGASNGEVWYDPFSFLSSNFSALPMDDNRYASNPAIRSPA